MQARDHSFHTSLPVWVLQRAEGMYFVGKYTAYLTCCIVFCGKVNNIPHLLESTPSSVLKVILMLSTIMKRC